MTMNHNNSFAIFFLEWDCFYSDFHLFDILVWLYDLTF